jgi:DNA-binding transcriptional LysR family regulator
VKLATAQRIVVASPDYLQRRGVPSGVAALAQHDCLGGPADEAREVWTFRRGDKREEAQVKIGIRTGSGAGVIACAAAGLGIAVASTWMCEQEVQDGRLVRILDDYALDPINAYVVFSSGRRPSRKARAFSEYLLAALKT